MKTAAARSGRNERSAHKVAEKLAKRAGVDFDDWIADAVGEYAEDLGVDPRDLSERERLEAIEDRIDRFARAEDDTPPARSRSDYAPPSHRDAPRSRRPDSRHDDDDEPRRSERNRLEQAIDRIEQRASRSAPRPYEARESERNRLEAAIQDVERRAERNEERTARALESLTGLVEARGLERSRLDQVVDQIEKRTARNEKRTAEALESLTGLVEARGGERDRLKEAIAKVEARAERNAERTARALESLTGLIDARKGERDRLETAIERVGKRAEETEARTARALETMSSLVQTPPVREDPVAARLDALARRAARAPEPAPASSEDDDTFRLVSERLARRRKARAEIEAPAPEPVRAAPPVEPLNDIQRELSRLAERVETLSGVGLAANQASRSHAQEIESALAVASNKAATIERMERQVVQLAQLVERLVGASPAPAELAQAVKALADVRAQIDRLAPGPALQALDRRIEELGRRIEAAAQRPAVDPRPFDDLARRVETMRATLERQAASRPDASALLGAIQALDDKIDRAASAGSQSAASMAALQGMVARVEEAMRRPAADPRPFDDLARRIEAMRATLERQAAARPDADDLFATLQALNDKIDRAAATGSQSAAAMAGLQGMVGRLEETLRRPAAFDARPLDDLARRIEGVRGAVGELTQKVDRPVAVAPEFERMEGALRQLARQVETALSRSAPVDMKPVEELAHRLDFARKAMEVQGAPAGQVERLETQLAEIRALLDRPVDNRQIEAVGATLRKLATRVDEAVSRPTTVSLDPKPIEDLARRIESVRESLENPPTFAPHVERLESVLGRVAAKLDQAGPVIDANGINSTLAAMNARLEEAFRHPVPSSLDREPIEALSARVEAVRESIERQSEQLDGVGRPFDELAKRLETLSQTVERSAGRFDVERIVEAVRGAAPALGGAETTALTGAIETLAAKLDRGLSGFDAAHIEDLLRQALTRLDRPAVDPAHLDALTDAVADLAEKVESPAAQSQRVAALLERIDARLDRPADPSADLGALVEIVSNLASHSGAPAQDIKRVEERLDSIVARLDRPGVEPGDFATMAEAIAELGHKLERSGGGAPSFTLLEELTRDVAFRLDAIENKIDDSALGAPVPGATAHLELALRELTEKLGEVRAAADTRGVEQEIRQLQERIEDVADTRMSSAFIEQAAQALARDVGERIAAATPDALLDLVRDIHDRIDLIGSNRPAPALEGALRELTDELEALRSARALVDRGVATLTDLRAEQSQFDRRMDARFTGVQDVLEKLVDRLGRLERDTPAEPRPAAPPRPSQPAAPTRPGMLEIPDRGPGETRSAAPLAETEPLTVEIAAQGRAREAAEGGNPKSAAINAHIAAARRAASLAAAEVERREDARSSASSDAPGLAQRAQNLFNQHRRPVLLGAAGLMTVLTGAAVLEMRGGHQTVRKSEIEAPATPSTPLAQAAPAASAALDETPTGAIATDAKAPSEPKADPAPQVIAAPIAAPKADDRPRPSSALVATLPQGLETALAAAGAKGDFGAEIEIAQRFLEGRNVPRDPKVAAQWLQAAADAGSAFAQYRLAAIYEKGIGAARDIERARTLYKSAADAGNARAMHNLAVLYAQDGGAGKPDYAAAMSWFRKAAEYGVRDSQFNLGVLYGRGLGATQDLAQSWMWFSLAAKQGDADAARKRDEVSNRMDGRVMAAAKTLIDNFHAKTPDPAVNDPPPVPAAAAADDAPKAATSVKG